MTVLRESPWYNDLLAEGLQQGLVQGTLEQLEHIITHRFGSVPESLHRRLGQLELPQLKALVDAALDAADLEGFRAQVDELPGLTHEANGGA